MSSSRLLYVFVEAGCSDHFMFYWPFGRAMDDSSDGAGKFAEGLKFIFRHRFAWGVMESDNDNNVPQKIPTQRVVILSHCYWTELIHWKYLENRKWIELEKKKKNSTVKLYIIWNKYAINWSEDILDAVIGFKYEYMLLDSLFFFENHQLSIVDFEIDIVKGLWLFFQVVP